MRLAFFCLNSFRAEPSIMTPYLITCQPLGSLPSIRYILFWKNFSKAEPSIMTRLLHLSQHPHNIFILLYKDKSILLEKDSFNCYWLSSLMDKTLPNSYATSSHWISTKRPLTSSWRGLSFLAGFALLILSQSITRTIDHDFAREMIWIEVFYLCAEKSSPIFCVSSTTAATNCVLPYEFV